MARGSSYGEKPPLSPIPVTPQLNIPRRATRILPEVDAGQEPETETIETELIEPATQLMVPARKRTTIDITKEDHPLARHRRWLSLWIISVVVIVLGALVVIAAGAYQRPGNGHIVPYTGQSFPIQLGGSISAFNTWQNSSGPIPTKTAILPHTGPYAVLGKPTITADFINRVLASYNSPAAGKGQAMYDLGVKYGIDPVYALAFFMHESLFGTTGEARATLSLGNLRCIPTRPCIDRDRGGYAQMYSWEDGFEQWYKLIRNLYVAQWGLVTVDQIIPVYAPSSDHNDVAGYIRALKYEIDTWHAGILRP